MPTIITHSLLGLGAATAWWPKKLPRRFWVLSLVLPILPDLDTVGLRFGVPYEHVFGHRGIFHSLPFALLVAVIVVSVFFRKKPLPFGRWLALVAYFFVLVGSHGVLDAMTNGGGGTALLAPFDNTRHFFDWRPIPVSPLGIRSFFSEWGTRVIIFEALWIWLPAGLVVAGIRLMTWARHRRRDARC